MRVLDAVLAFVVAMAVAAVLTPLAARLARRVGAVDMPRERGLASARRRCSAGWRSSPACWSRPRSGCRADHAAATLRTARPDPAAPSTPGRDRRGVPDRARRRDRRRPDLPPAVKLIGQIAAAVIAVEAGAVVTDVTLPFVGALQFPNDGRLLTVIWLVALMNVVNFSDGVDGLAPGVCTIDGVAFAIIAFDLGVDGAAILAALTAGAALGFLFHNFHPATVFMGDSGANLLGYLLGVVAVIGSLKTNAVVALVVPLLILAVPFLDTGFVIAKRLKYRRKPWSADANHFHHRMARIGFSQRKTVAYLYALDADARRRRGRAAVRPVPRPRRATTTSAGCVVMVCAIVLLALRSVYLVYVLEIFKFKGLRRDELRRLDPDTSEHEIDAAGRSATSRPASSSA